MRRLYFLRVVVAVVLAAFVVIVLLALRGRPEAPDAAGEQAAARADRARLEGFTITDIVGDRRRLAVSARIGSWDDEGGFQAEDIERIEVDRDEGAPLIVSAAQGRGSGTPGRRVIRLEGGVEVRDDESGLVVKIPTIELDQGAGLLRSLGEVVIASPELDGRASSAVYPLDGRPTELFGLEVHGQADSVLRARRATLPRGGRVVELEGEVEITRGTEVLAAERLRAERDATGAWTAAQAVGAVRGSSSREGGPAARFRALKADLAWTASEVSRVVLSGEAFVEQAGRTLQADTVVATRRGDGWDVAASGGVTLAGPVTTGAGRLQAASLEASLDHDGRIDRGRAAGGVRFEGKDAAGEGDAAELARRGTDERVTLVSGSGRRARLAVGRTRINADTIVTAQRGAHLEAEGRVEATLLPDPARRESTGRTAIFEGRETIHFVASRLEADDSGKILRFRQNVRGWQADRNLSADEVDVDERADALDARGRVSTRFPRGSSSAPAGAFLQVSSETLRYRGSEGLATYAGGARARMDEGWIECARLEVVVAKGGGLQEVRGFDGVRFEFRAPPESGSAAPEPVTGTADRLVYAPEAGWVRLFGDRSPAEVRRGGPDGGTTAGRVLRYALETGRIEVESGSAGRGGPARGTR